MCNTVQFGESLDVGLCGYQGKKIEISWVRENEDGVKLQTFKTTTLQMLEPSRKKNETKNYHVVVLVVVFRDKTIQDKKANMTITFKLSQPSCILIVFPVSELNALLSFEKLNQRVKL